MNKSRQTKEGWGGGVGGGGGRERVFSLTLYPHRPPETKCFLSDCCKNNLVTR